VGIIPHEMRRMLEDLARTTHFVQRTYKRLFAQARSSLPNEWSRFIDPLQSWVAEHTVDQKQADAIGLLRWLAASPGAPDGCASREPEPFRMTEAWAADLEASGLYPDELLGPRVLPPSDSQSDACQI